MTFAKQTLPLLLLIVTACSAEQKNGDLRVYPAPLLADQQWEITEQAITPSHDRVCTISAGGIDITQRAHDDSIMVQVETPAHMEPGSWYAIVVGAHRYESAGNHFDATQSQLIIDDFSTADKAYTEWREYIGEGSDWRWFSNTIPLAGFGSEYQACTHYIKASQKLREP